MTAITSPNPWQSASPVKFQLGPKAQQSSLDGDSESHKKPVAPATGFSDAKKGERRCSGTETCRLNQTYLIATSSELTALVALYDHTSTGFDANDTGTNPAEGG